jgi:methionyl aminopeptidase
MGTVGESTIERPIALANKRPNGITIKSPAEFELMKAAGKVVAEVKALLTAAIRPGVTTENLDAIAETAIRAAGATPSFKGYLGYPASICTSINEEIVHGIPAARVLNEGDLLSVDVGAIVDGLHADSAFSVGVGEVSQETSDLIDATREALLRGIEQVKVGARIGDISAAVQAYAEGRGYTLVRQYVGHGIGYAMHEDPSVPNFGPAGRGPLLKEGMAIAIEPMLNIGTWKTEVLNDEWTVVTADGRRSAHFEDTVLVTQDGPVVTTAI